MAIIRVNRPCEVVWNIFTDTKSWKIWWGGTLKRVNPNWQVGATLEWEGGDEGNILDFHPLKRIAVTGNHNEISTWSFTADEHGSTVVGIEVDLSNLLLRETNPGAMEIELQSPLSKLKKYVESISKTGSIKGG